MTVQVVIGWDPSVAPAAAVYAGPAYSPMLFPPMGISREMPSKLKRRAASRAKTYDPAKPTKLPKPATDKVPTETDPDEAAILGIMDAYPMAVGALEKVGVRPGQGIASSGRFMHSAGLLQGMILGRNRRLIMIRPQEWRKAWKMPEGKEVSRMVVRRAWPNLMAQTAAVKTHNECDALLIATYVWHLENGIPLPRF